MPLVIAGSVRPRIVVRTRGLRNSWRSSRTGCTTTWTSTARDVELTDAGIERVEQALGCGSLHERTELRLLTELNCALHAQRAAPARRRLPRPDGRIGVIDELTGRVVPDRHWPDGLQAALEAKEGLDRQSDGRILGSMTLQHFLRGYPRLCGMTGTAQTAAPELHASTVCRWSSCRRIAR